MQNNVQGTPYLLGDEQSESAVFETIRALTERVELLRAQGSLSVATLEEYYGQTRFAQIAESNALEGSTLSIGETELAVLKGITISGHDPAYSRDARTLATAIDELASIARLPEATNIAQLLRLHDLILGGRPGAGVFRTSEVRIRGANHVPPSTWDGVINGMEQWEAWSVKNASAPPILRAAVLHAWLEHIHPFIDGNGRTGRAISNLELVRAGYPPIILRRKDRDQYLDALARADNADIGPFLDVIVGRTEDALRDLERAASRRQGYDIVREQVRRSQENRLALWNAGVNLLLANIKSRLSDSLGSGGELKTHRFDQLSVEDFVDLCEGTPVRLSWAFIVTCRFPTGRSFEFLAWAGTVGEQLRNRLGDEPGRPALMWSVPNPDKYPPWVRADTRSPGGQQLTIFKDRWLRVRDNEVDELLPSAMADDVVDDIIRQALPPGEL